MTADNVTTIEGTRVLHLAEPAFDETTLASDIIGLAWQHDATVIAIDSDRLPASFFDLRSGLIGDVSQKCANYRVTLAVVGDMSAYIKRSKAFADYVFETNQGQVLWFVADMETLSRKLAA